MYEAFSAALQNKADLEADNVLRSRQVSVVVVKIFPSAYSVCNHVIIFDHFIANPEYKQLIESE